MQSFKLFLKLKFALSKGPKYIIFYPIITETLSKNLEVFYFRLKKKKVLKLLQKFYSHSC